MVKSLFLKQRMLGDEPLLTSRAILCGDQQITILSELVEHQQVFGGSGSQEERRLDAAFVQLLAEIEQSEAGREFLETLSKIDDIPVYEE